MSTDQQKGAQSKATAVPDAGPEVVAHDAFCRVIARPTQRLLEIGNLLTQSWSQPLTRPLLAGILDASTQLEELLDAYGARNSARWVAFRESVAMAKNFAAGGYTLLHIKHSRRRYQLLEVPGDFAAEIEQALAYITDVLQCTFRRLLEEADGLIPLTAAGTLCWTDFGENLPAGTLPQDRRSDHEASTAERIVHVATSVLELTAASEFLDEAARAAPPDYAGLVPEPVCEESLRQLEYGFHNLQSLYDTFVSDSRTESADPELRILRGHISVVLHLLEAGTVLVHFYERHIAFCTALVEPHRRCDLDRNRHLAALMGCCVLYASRYLQAVRGLCHAMLRRYATMGRIEVPVPRYRGFHVRPSMLIAKIVRHYGSDITMRLEGEAYDAGSTLELFRANEAINAEKRQRLAEAITALDLDVGAVTGKTQLVPVVRRAVLELAERNRIVIYEQPLPLKGVQWRPGLTTAELVRDEIMRLLMAGKIDIQSDLRVHFEGDERVLKDIEILAENGYCEDRFGNNTPLPAGLSYLKRD